MTHHFSADTVFRVALKEVTAPPPSVAATLTPAALTASGVGGAGVAAHITGIGIGSSGQTLTVNV
jgi:hypothetical protein